jgi:cytochrome P450
MSMHHLATHPEDRRKVATAPDTAGHTAVEELMRLWAVPELARKVTRDTVLGGVQLHKDDMLLLPLAAAGRDPRYAENAREFVLDRTADASHVAFGAGVHRCLGAHLARQELNVAIEEWHRLIPEYQLAEQSPVVETFGSVHGLASLTLSW